MPLKFHKDCIIAEEDEVDLYMDREEVVEITEDEAAGFPCTRR